jgi:hypothetical protein
MADMLNLIYNFGKVAGERLMDDSAFIYVPSLRMLWANLVKNQRILP